MTWRRACDSSSCVEVHTQPDGTRLLRDSERPSEQIHVSAQSWAEFIHGVKEGRFDE